MSFSLGLQIFQSKIFSFSRNNVNMLQRRDTILNILVYGLHDGLLAPLLKE